MTTESRRALLILATMAFTILPVAAKSECSPSDLSNAQQSYSTAYQFVQANQWAEAIPSLSEAVKSCPEHWPSVELMAGAQMRVKAYTESADWYATLIAGQYDGVMATVESRVLQPYGFVLLKNRDWPAATHVYESILTHDPANKEAHERLVLAYSNAGDLGQAIFHLESLYAMETGEKQKEVAARIGKAYQKEGDNDTAKQWFEMSGGGTAGMFQIALEHFQKGEWTDAADGFRKYLQGKPKSVPAWKNLGQALQKMNRRSDAIAAYETALEIDPERHDVTSSLGFLYSEGEQWNKAAGLAEPAVKNWSESVKEKDSMYFLMGKIFEKRDSNYERAIEMFKQAKDDPYWGALAVKEIDRQEQLIKIRTMQANQGR